MADAAETQVAEEAAPAEVFDGEGEMPNFNIYSAEEPEQEEAVEAKEEPAGEEAKEEPKKADASWSSKIKKDRDQNKREIELKKREQEIANRESRIVGAEELRGRFIKDPEGFLKEQGIDPIDFYADWTNRLARGTNEVGSDLRLSENERELKELKEELKRRDNQRLREHADRQQEQEIQKFYSKIEDYMGSTDAEKYPLTTEQCTAQDIAQGIGAYYQQTGIELSFDEAFQKVEEGLRSKEDEIFNDPKVIAKFKKLHGLDASVKKGKRSHLTLSNSLEAQPTKTPTEDMTDEEIHDYWKGKLFIND